MRKMLFSLLFLLTMAVAGQDAAGKFDGAWNSTVTCDPKGSSLGYTWHFVSTVTGNVLHGERGAQGQPAYLAIDGKIGDDGKAKLTANGSGRLDGIHARAVRSVGRAVQLRGEVAILRHRGQRRAEHGTGHLRPAVPLDL